MILWTGGETARAVLDAVAAAGIRLLGEVEPGVPLGTAAGWRDLPVVTKSRGIGYRAIPCTLSSGASRVK